MSNCLFCEIMKGNIPSRKVYEDDKVYAFLDISQTTPGHTLVIPKVHVRNIFEMDSDVAADLFSRVPMIAKAIKDSNENIKGANIVINNEEIAYQTVFHSHIHIIPRYSDEDDFSMTFKDNSKEYSDEVLDELQEQIASKVEKGAK
ncbi:MAG TPA: HIT family protein [Alloiococcus sp.]|nr:HIT family protein [Alloiococcus sp.]